MGVSELFATIAQWATLKGAANLPDKPGLWEGDLGEFRIAINAHMEGYLKTREGLSVGPMQMAVNAPKYLGAVMLLDVSGGIGAAGMEADVLAALNADIARMEGA